MDLAQSIVINSKEEKNSNINNIWSFYDENSDVSQIDPKESLAEKSYISQEYPKTRIKDEPKDVVGMEIEKTKNG